MGKSQEPTYGSADHCFAEARGAGRTVDDVARECGLSAETIYAWKAKFGGMDASEAQRLKSLEGENSRVEAICRRSKLGSGDAEGCEAKRGLSS